MKKYSVILLMLMLCLHGFSQIPYYVPPDSLMGWWPFNNNAMDESPGTNDGTVNGAVPTTDQHGTPNKAYDFDGINDGITIPAVNMSGYNEMSISVWVNPSSLSTHAFHEIVRQDNGYTSYPDFLLSFQYNGSFLAFGVGTTTTYSELDFPTSPSYFLNTWHHIVAIYDGINKRIYVNAVQVAANTQSGNVRHTSSTFTVGCEPTYMETHEFYKGKIDDLGIWKRALTEQEINTLYNGGLTTGLNENSPEITRMIYPNPATGAVYLKNYGEIVKARIYSVAGAMISEHIIPGDNRIELSHLSAGSYVISLYDKDNTPLKKEKLILLQSP